MPHPKQGYSSGPDSRAILGISRKAAPHLNINSEYSTVVNSARQFVEVSPAFCKLLGYSEKELIGKPYDEFSVPGTNDIPTILELFAKTGYMHGIWVFRHRSGTKLLVRYEAFVRSDGLYEGHMDLFGAGA
jgi:PAS domain S-box-containing protein